MKKVLLTGIVSLGLLAVPLLASATPVKVEGTVRGYDCVASNNPNNGCGIGSQEAMIKAQAVFVVDTANGYYFLPNVSRELLARYATDKVVVTGELDAKARTIHASTMRVKTGNQWTQAF